MIRTLALLLLAVSCALGGGRGQRSNGLESRPGLEEAEDLLLSPSTTTPCVGSFKEAMISAHNAVRADLSVAPKHPLKKMQWSEDLARDAQQYVSTCPVYHLRFERDAGRPEDFVVRVLANSENIHYAAHGSSGRKCPAEQAQRAVNNWAEEKKDWRFSMINPDIIDPERALGCNPRQQGKTCMHYLNMIMEENFDFGCAINEECSSCGSQNPGCTISRKCPAMQISSTMSPAEVLRSRDRFLKNEYSECSSKKARVKGNYGSTTIVCRYRVVTSPIRRLGGKGSLVLPYTPASGTSGRIVGAKFFFDQNGQRYIGDQHFSNDVKYAYSYKASDDTVKWIPIKSSVCAAIDTFAAEHPTQASHRRWFLTAICRDNKASMSEADIAAMCPPTGASCTENGVEPRLASASTSDSLNTKYVYTTTTREGTEGQIRIPAHGSVCSAIDTYLKDQPWQEGANRGWYLTEICSNNKASMTDADRASMCPSSHRCPPSPLTGTREERRHQHAQ